MKPLTIDHSTTIELLEPGLGPVLRSVHFSALYHPDTDEIELVGVFDDESGLEVSSLLDTKAWAVVDASALHWGRARWEREQGHE